MYRAMLVVDARNMIDRFWYACKDMEKTKIMILNALDKIVDARRKEDVAITHCLIAYDISGNKESVRHSYYPAYKQKRPASPVEVQAILKDLIETLESRELFCIGNKLYEADDFIGAAVKIAELNNLLCFVVSTDKDITQLISNTTFVVDIGKDYKVIGPNDIVEKFGILPSQVLDYLSLMGDSSDGIPGVKGIGKLTAAKLLVKFGSIASVYKNIEKITPTGLKKKLEEGIDDCRLSYRLVKLHSSILDESFKLPMCQIRVGQKFA